MALYVIRPANPDPGTDWTATVPGQYLYDVTGITATLTTSSGAPVTAIDSSGSGQNLAYNNPNVAFGIAGYVTGNFMVQNISATTVFVATGTVDTSWITGNDLFFNVWTDMVPPAGTGPPYVVFVGAASHMEFFSTTGGAPPGQTTLILSWTNTDATTGFIAATGVLTAGRHLLSVRLDLGAAGGQFYVDGAPFDAFDLTSGFNPLIDLTGTLEIGGKDNLLGPFPFYDEVAIGGNPSVDADYANLYAQRGSFAAYTAAQIAMGPEMYYHLDETGVGVGRQVALAITDGTYTTELIPTGFFESTAAGPFFYSWQPKLNSDSQTPDGTNTTVAIPQLLLPAGYTIGSDTLDLSSTDQWSDIAIWWNSDYMDALDNPYEYQFEPGFKLDYHQDANLPEGDVEIGDF